MRKFWVLIWCLAGNMRLAAQLPSDTLAPDFTATDLNGQAWHLYDMLDQGKVVVLEISATWCAPCWAYHNGHAMQKFYEAHGPAGDDKARVLFIEGDPKTNVNCLYGAAGCNDYTPGNWVAGTPFPIINEDSLAETFRVTYFPTLFVVCPNRKIYEVGQWDADQLWEQASTCPVASGVNNAGIFEYATGTPLHDICETLNTKPAFTLINLGSEALTQATLSLQWNQTTVQTIEWSGYLGLYEEVPISFDDTPLSSPGQLSTTLTHVNNQPNDDDISNNIRTDSFGIASTFNSQKILLKIRTDAYGAETYWELRDEAGQVLEKGGNQAVGPNGGGKFPAGIPDGPGAYNNNALIRDTLVLPEPGCYSIHFADAFGDGMCCQYGNGYFKLYNLDNPTVPILSGGDFRQYEHRGFSAGILTAVQDPEATVPTLQIAPNPADQDIQANYRLPADAHVGLFILNTLGQVVRSRPAEIQSAGEQQYRFALGELPPGLYWLQLQVNGRHTAKPFVIQH
ncbi:MAG: redoxin domain-containing protein [Saprospiraceae bacterium]|nr:redoxin domain-containing protein [Saprospiraceae bacterium]